MQISYRFLWKIVNCYWGIIRLLGIQPSVPEWQELKGPVERLLYIVMYSHLTLDAAAARFHGFTLQQRTCGDAVSHSPPSVISDALYDTTASIRFWIFLIKLSFVYSTSFVWNCGNVVPRIRSACPATPAGRAPAPVPALVPACLRHELRQGYPVETHAASVVQSHLPIVFKWYWLSFHFIMDVKYVTERFVLKISFKDVRAYSKLL